MSRLLSLGALPLESGGCSFRVWAPRASEVELHLVHPKEERISMAKAGEGYWKAIRSEVRPGTRYFYRLDGKVDRPDPASRSQPEGVHGASEVAGLSFDWQDADWFGIPLNQYILYELHIGTFTREGTFDGVVEYLPRLRDLGITAVELMPVAQFPGTRNWGYDGVCWFAVQNSYGGPLGLKRLINACHRAGLAVVLDVVYNHFGPEGNYLQEFGPYFDESGRTQWGAAINFDGSESDAVRRFVLENALYWQTEFHVDALRLDAVHALRDSSALPILQELARATHRQADRLNRRFYLIAESDLNDPRLIRSEALGGYGLDAQWSDDFHHCLHVLLTGEREGYYADFEGVRQFAKVFREGYAFTGDYSRHRRRRHGASPSFTSAKQFVVYSQNHDQIGNRCRGERLSRLATFDELKLAAGAVLLSPFIPLLFMGEEYGELAPFQYITSHSDPDLVEAVRAGRRQEFAHFHDNSPAPDPQAEATFLQSKLNLDLPKDQPPRRLLLEFYRELMQLRKRTPALIEADKGTIEVQSLGDQSVLLLRYWTEGDEVLLILCFAKETVEAPLQIPKGTWKNLLDSSSPRWHGAGTPLPAQLKTPARFKLNPTSIALFQRQLSP